MSFPVSYLDFLAITRTNKKSRYNQFLNEALNQSYLLSALIKANGMENVSQGGQKIVDFIQTGTNGSFSFYAPGDQQTPVATDTMKQIEGPWRFSSANYAFENEEKALNEQDVDKFIRLMDAYESACVTDIVQGTEDSLWGVPSSNDMEATGGRKPYSIPVFINELTSSIPSGFTTVMGVNPSSVPVWRNQQEGYTMSTIATAASATGLLTALLKMSEKVNFRPVPFGTAKKYQEDSKLSKLMIVTSVDGLVQYQNCLYNTNDKTAKISDAGNPSWEYRGYPLMQVTALSYAGIYSGAVAGTTDTVTHPITGASITNAAKIGAPRYYFMNGEYLKPIFNKESFMDDSREPMCVGVDRPNSYVKWFFNQQQLWCSSRKRHGIVYPSAT